MTEQLRQIPDLDGYHADHLGRIWGPNGKGGIGPLPASKRKDGYVMVFIKSDGAKDRPLSVHRAVCLAFHGEPPTPGAQACHVDHDPGNNAPQNLLWGTPAQNREASKLAGRYRRGERHPRAKLSDADVIGIKAAAAFEVPVKKIAERWGVSPSYVYAILRGKKRAGPAAPTTD